MRLAAAALAVGIALAPCMAFGQTYPSKPIRMVVPFPPGGTSDVIGRTLGQKLSEAWNQPVIMDNRSGVAGSIGAAATAKAPPDGYTLVVGNVGPVAVNPSIYKSVGYDPVKDFTPITLAVTAPQIVVVHPSVPAKTFQEFNALVKRHWKNQLRLERPGQHLPPCGGVIQAGDEDEHAARALQGLGADHDRASCRRSGRRVLPTWPLCCRTCKRGSCAHWR